MRRRKKKIYDDELMMNILIPSANSGTAGDLLACNCCYYVCNANDQEMMGPGGQRLPGTKILLWPDNWQAPTSNCMDIV
jgi:hypothetical protein